MKPRAELAFVVVGILWGSAWIPVSTVLREMPGLRVGALRFAIAAAFAAVVAAVMRLRKNTRKPFAPLGASLLLGATAVGLPYALTVWSAGRASSGVVAVLFAFMPLAAVWMSREGASAAIPALVIGAGGVAFLVAQGLAFSIGQAAGALLILCAVLLGAFSLNYARKHLASCELVASAAIQLAFAAVFLGVLSAFTERGQPSTASSGTYLALLVLGVAVSGVTLPLMYWLLTELASWQVATLQWSATLVAVAESAWFLRAKPSTQMWMGAALIVGATFWLLRGDGSGEPEAVTLQLTNHTGEALAASESEVGSK
jgi:drug/metabolite transporter (DMT)-like permease